MILQPLEWNAVVGALISFFRFKKRSSLPDIPFEGRNCAEVCIGARGRQVYQPRGPRLGRRMFFSPLFVDLDCLWLFTFWVAHGLELGLIFCWTRKDEFSLR